MALGHVRSRQRVTPDPLHAVFGVARRNDRERGQAPVQFGTVCFGPTDTGGDDDCLKVAETLGTRDRHDVLALHEQPGQGDLGWCPPRARRHGAHLWDHRLVDGPVVKRLASRQSPAAALQETVAQRFPDSPIADTAIESIGNRIGKVGEQQAAVSGGRKLCR